MRFEAVFQAWYGSGRKELVNGCSGRWANVPKGTPASTKPSLVTYNKIQISLKALKSIYPRIPLPYITQIFLAGEGCEIQRISCES
jgi:hypothetical protein